MINIICACFTFDSFNELFLHSRINIVLLMFYLVYCDLSQRTPVILELKLREDGLNVDGMLYDTQEQLNK